MLQIDLMIEKTTSDEIDGPRTHVRITRAKDGYRVWASKTGKPAEAWRERRIDDPEAKGLYPLLASVFQELTK